MKLRHLIAIGLCIYVGYKFVDFVTTANDSVVEYQSISVNRLEALGL